MFEFLIRDQIFDFALKKDNTVPDFYTSEYVLF